LDNFFIELSMKPDEIRIAGEMLRRGELVAFPTETVYGLGANALQDSAVQRIFDTKGRPSDNPLIVHVASLEAIRPLVIDIPDIVQQLAARFWPGPLSIVLPINPTAGLSPLVTAGLSSVGIRIPDHETALALLTAAGVPVAAPSANKSGSPSPTTAAHVLSDFPSLHVLDSGSCRFGLESTVIKLTPDGKIRILRPGGISKDQLESLVGEGNVEDGFSSTPVARSVTPDAPGMKYRHYAPKARLVPFESQAELQGMLDEYRNDLDEYGNLKDIAVIAFEGCHISDDYKTYRLNFGCDVEDACQRLFGALRTCDTLYVKVIFIDVGFDKTTGHGVALWNRISKASQGETDKL
jgi:L-threonylcarbamoyladenylate synthase